MFVGTGHSIMDLIWIGLDRVIVEIVVQVTIFSSKEYFERLKASVLATKQEKTVRKFQTLVID